MNAGEVLAAIAVSLTGILVIRSVKDICAAIVSACDPPRIVLSNEFSNKETKQ